MYLTIKRGRSTALDINLELNNMMKATITKLFVALILFANVSAWAGQEKSGAKTEGKNVITDVLLYIQPVEYTNPIRLSNHYSYAYWFEQGPIVESLALNKMDQAYGTVSMCEASRSAKVLVWLQPRMFYNPQSQIFYGQVTANVYAGKGELKGIYKGKSSLHGFLDIKPEVWIQKSYALAVDKMVNKMKADKTLQALIDSHDQTNNMDGTQCSMVTSFPIPKIRALSF